MNLAVGVDAGGTSTRAWVVAPGGRLGQERRGRGIRTPPAESAARRWSRPPGRRDRTRSRDVRAWSRHGGRSNSPTPTSPPCSSAWARLGFPTPRPRLVTDAEAAFVSATAEPDGTARGGDGLDRRSDPRQEHGVHGRGLRLAAR